MELRSLLEAVVRRRHERLHAVAADHLRRALAGAGLVEAQEVPGPPGDPDLVNVVARRAPDHR